VKYFSTIMAHLRGSRTSRQNLRLLLRYFLFLAGLVTAYAVLFHYIMAMEGQEHTWVTGFYWTLVTMSTLGYGDVRFEGDLGRVFSMVVLLSGILSLLVLLPFTFIEFFYAPFIRAQSRARVPRELPLETRGHVVLTNYDPVTIALIEKLRTYATPHVLLTPDLQRALELTDLGVNVVLGALDDPDSYRRVSVERAALVAATSADIANANISFTVRELTGAVPIIATARSEQATEILKLAGATQVLQLGEMLGQALARRIIGGDARAHVIGRFDSLLIAEATAAGTPLVGKTLVETRLRELVGINVVGISERGQFEIPRPETRIKDASVLVLAGSAEQIARYDELFCIYHQATGSVVIIGSGRVGRAIAAALEQRQVGYRIVERLADRVPNRDKAIIGNAADRDTLEQAGIREAPALAITTHDDDLNIYLTIFCRRLREDIQIISRATMEKNVPTLHRAGADVVMGYASMGANAIFNFARNSDILMLADGLNVFRVDTPSALIGKRLAETQLRRQTGCNVVALRNGTQLLVNPGPDEVLQPDSHLILIGNVGGEKLFLKLYGKA
jgi:voltage-gated potassium channel